MLLRALLLTLMLPGLGHLFLGRVFRGLCFVFGFTAFAAGAAFRGIMAENPLLDGLFLLLSAGGMAIWFGAFFGVLRLVLRPALNAVRPEREAFFRAGVTYYLRDELSRAAEAFRRVLALDPLDADAYLHLGTVLKELGNRRQARRCFKRCVECDPEGKWRQEVAQELELLSHARELR